MERRYYYRGAEVHLYTFDPPGFTADELQPRRWYGSVVLSEDGPTGQIFFDPSYHGWPLRQTFREAMESAAQIVDRIQERRAHYRMLDEVCRSVMSERRA